MHIVVPIDGRDVTNDGDMSDSDLFIGGSVQDSRIADDT